MGTDSEPAPGKLPPGENGKGRDRTAVKRERLARALRENLKRRKDHARGAAAKDNAS